VHTQRFHPCIAKLHPHSFRLNAPKTSPKQEALRLTNFFKDELLRNEHFVYLCSPFAATKEKSIKDHVLEALKASSEMIGTKYKKRLNLLFIPHLHGFALFNESADKRLRDYGLTFTTHFIKKVKPIIAVADGRISEGMKRELYTAKKFNVKSIKLSQLKSKLKNLPTKKESEEVFSLLLNLFPANFIK